MRDRSEILSLDVQVTQLACDLIERRLKIGLSRCVEILVFRRRAALIISLGIVVDSGSERDGVNDHALSFEIKAGLLEALVELRDIHGVLVREPER